MAQIQPASGIADMGGTDGWGRAPVPAPDEPVFKEPWEAEAFALAVSLQERELFTWGEWALALGDEIKRAQAAGDPDTGATLFGHVHLLTQKGYGHPFPTESADKYHAVNRFDLIEGTNGLTGTPVKSGKPAAPTYTKVFADALTAEAERDDRIVDQKQLAPLFEIQLARLCTHADVHANQACHQRLRAELCKKAEAPLHGRHRPMITDWRD